MQSAINNLAALVSGLQVKGSAARSALGSSQVGSDAQTTTQVGDDHGREPSDNALIAALAASGMPFEQIVQKLATAQAAQMEQAPTADAQAVQAVGAADTAAIAMAQNASAGDLAANLIAQAQANVSAIAEQQAPATNAAATTMNNVNDLAALMQAQQAATQQSAPLHGEQVQNQTSAAASNVAQQQVNATAVMDAPRVPAAAQAAMAAAQADTSVQNASANPAQQGQADKNAPQNLVANDSAAQLKHVTNGSLQKVYGATNTQTARNGKTTATTVAAAIAETASQTTQPPTHFDVVATAPTIPMIDAPTTVAVPAASQPVATPMTTQIVDAVQGSSSPLGQQVVIQLDPPELGKVQLTLNNQDGNGLAGVLKVDNPRTMAELQRETPMLINRLNDSGMEVRKIEVVLNDNGSGQSSLQGQHSSQGQWAQQQAQRDLYSYDRETGYTSTAAEQADEGELVGAGSGGLSYWA